MRHLSIKSIVIPIPDEEETYMEDEATETCQEEGCRDCKKKLQVALLDTLPHPVGSGLYTYCQFIGSTSVGSVCILPVSTLVPVEFL